MLVHTESGPATAVRPAGPSHNSPEADELHAIALACAREFCSDYNNQQDLASRTLLAALQYNEVIQFPEQFMRKTARNLAINHARSVGARELTGCQQESALHNACLREAGLALDPCSHLILSDTLSRMERELTPSELRCYRLLCEGYEQRDLPRLLGVSRQAVSRILASIRGKYLAADSPDMAGR